MHDRSREASIPRQHYTDDRYDTLGRFVGYWHQIDSIRSAQPENALEIGMGNGFVTGYLRARGMDVVTLDVNPALGADVLGSITAIPYAAGSFDVVTACEVLEHLPQESVTDALREMRRVARNVSIVSVPDIRTVYPFQVSVPHVGVIRRLIPRPCPGRSLSCPDHHWEIGHDAVSPADVKKRAAAAGWSVERDWRPFENPTHHFFVLRKMS